MVTNALVLPETEIYNSYDPHLSNARLMVQYGFMLEGNSNDVVEWSCGDVETIVGLTVEEKECRMRLWTCVADVDLSLDQLGIDELLYNPNDSDEGDDEDTEPGEPPDPNTSRSSKDPSALLCINANAQVSQQLYLFILLHRLPFNNLLHLLNSESDPPSPNNGPLVQLVKSLLVFLDTSRPDTFTQQPVFNNQSGFEPLKVVSLVKSDLIHLLNSRLRGMYWADRTVEEIGNELVRSSEDNLFIRYQREKNQSKCSRFRE